MMLFENQPINIERDANDAIYLVISVSNFKKYDTMFMFSFLPIRVYLFI